jgi:hypothetical protein
MAHKRMDNAALAQSKYAGINNFFESRITKKLRLEFASADEEARRHHNIRLAAKGLERMGGWAGEPLDVLKFSIRHLDHSFVAELQERHGFSQEKIKETALKVVNLEVTKGQYLIAIQVAEKYLDDETARKVALAAAFAEKKEGRYGNLAMILKNYFLDTELARNGLKQIELLRLGKELEKLGKQVDDIRKSQLTDHEKDIELEKLYDKLRRGKMGTKKHATELIQASNLISLLREKPSNSN